MPLWVWISVSLVAGITLGVIIWTMSYPRVATTISQTPGPELPEHLAPGWYAQCSKCGKARTLASVGGIRIGANRGAKKATLGWCRACQGLRIVRIIHKSRLVGRVDT